MLQRRKVVAYNTLTGEEYVYVRKASWHRIERYSVVNRYGDKYFIIDKNLTHIIFHDGLDNVKQPVKF